jgi:hypothetical protein
VRSRLAAEVGRLVRVRARCTAAYRGADVRAAQPWVATAYVPGRSLAAHVAEQGPLTGGILTALAAGLELLEWWTDPGELYAHTQARRAD